jgi:stromal membrane-associated protein
MASFRYWEANLKDNKPNESNMDMWVRSKYELKRWAMKGPIPDPSSLKGGATSSATTTTTQQVIHQ